MQMAFDAAGVVPALLEIVTTSEDTHTNSLIAALGAVKVLCTNCNELQTKFAGAIKHAARWINTPPVSLQLAAAGAMWILVDGEEEQHAAVMLSCKDSLKTLEKQSENAKELLHATRAFSANF